MLTEVVPANPTEDTLKEICERLKTQADVYGAVKYLIKFSKPTTIIKRGRYVDGLTKMSVRTFFSKQKNFCYTFGSRTGYPFRKINMDNIQSISLPTKDEHESQEQLQYLNRVKHALKILHPNAWDNLRTELVDDPSHFKYYGGFLKIFIPKKYKNMHGGESVLYKSVFPEHILRVIENGFETKTNFSQYIYRTNYRFGVEGNLGTDGVYRAWYSREVKGGGANWNYLLLNPTTAWFVEKD